MNEIGLKRATTINFVAKYLNVFMQLIINSILARLLSPQDFGIVAIVMVFITFFGILADMGIGPAIIQNKQLKNRNISDIFIFSIFSGVIIAIAFVIFSYFIAYFYENSIYIILGRFLSISIFFSVANIVPNALMLKNKQFKLLGITNIFVNMIVGIITIILALKGVGYYSLVINSILINTLLFIINFLNSKIEVCLDFSWESIKIIKDYSIYQFGFNFVNYFSRNLDNILVGKFLGASSIGFYDKAYKLMLYPLQNLTFVITPVLHPILSDYQDNKDVIYDYFVKVVKLLSLLGIYVGLVCFFCSKEIIIILFGHKWIKSIPPFKILSISIWIQMISSCSGSIFQAAGRTKELFKCGIITAINTIICIFIGVSTKSIEYVSTGVVVAFFVNFAVICYILIYGVFNKNISSFVRNLHSSILIAVFVIAVMILIPINIDNVLISGIVKGIIITIVYLCGLLLTKEFKFIKKILIK